jgi:hypothetical protein
VLNLNFKPRFGGAFSGQPGMNSTELHLHHAQAPAVLNHSRTLPQGDGVARPAFAGGAEGEVGSGRGHPSGKTECAWLAT